MILYADSSSILSFHLLEAGRHAIVEAAFEAADRVSTSLIALAEVRAGLARARFKSVPPRLSASEYEKAVRDFLRDWRSYGRVAVSASLVQRAGALAESYRLRGYDAVHLASAVTLNESLPGEIYLSTWDQELADAAQLAGLSLAHEVTT